MRLPRVKTKIFKGISLSNKNDLAASSSNEIAPLSYELYRNRDNFTPRRWSSPSIFIRYDRNADIRHLVEHLKESIRPGLALCKQIFPNDDGYELYTLEELRHATPQQFRDMLKTTRTAPVVEAEKIETRTMTFQTRNNSHSFLEKLSVVYTFLRLKLCSFHIRVFQEEWSKMPFIGLHLHPQVMMKAMPSETTYLTTPDIQMLRYAWIWCPLVLDSHERLELTRRAERDWPIQAESDQERRLRNTASYEEKRREEQIYRLEHQQAMALKTRLWRAQPKATKSILKVTHEDRMAQRKLERTKERMKRRGTWISLLAGSISQRPGFLQGLLKGTKFEELHRDIGMSPEEIEARRNKELALMDDETLVKYQPTEAQRLEDIEEESRINKEIGTIIRKTGKERRIKGRERRRELWARWVAAVSLLDEPRPDVSTEEDNTNYPKFSDLVSRTNEEDDIEKRDDNELRKRAV